MNRSLVFAVAVATASLLSLSAHAQSAGDIQRVSKVIAADPAKKQAYCEIGKLESQIGEADQKKDTKKFDELVKKANDLTQKVGPEYVKLQEALEKIDPDSAEGKKLAPAMQEMSKLCR